jgi:hypothetical protein
MLVSIGALTGPAPAVSFVQCAKSSCVKNVRLREPSAETDLQQLG